MNINCPYCYSENVSRVMPQPTNTNNNLSSMTCAGLGATLSKSFPIPFSPLLGGLAGAVVGGLIDSLMQPNKVPQQPVPYFHCHSCQCDFQ